jgi:hypothetical protein
MTLSQFRYIYVCPAKSATSSVKLIRSIVSHYFKGSGNEYADWKEHFCLDKRYLPPIRVLGGNQQDAAFEGALPVYDG